MEQERDPNAPTERQGVPLVPARRHSADRLTVRSMRHTNQNTVIMPWVDVIDDVKAIRDGLAQRDGNTFVVHG